MQLNYAILSHGDSFDSVTLILSLYLKDINLSRMNAWLVWYVYDAWCTIVVAEDTCPGVVSYERFPGYELTGVQDDIIRLSQDPESVVTSCVSQCHDHVSGTCHSISFLPGQYRDGRWTESTCSLFRERPSPEGKLETSSNHFAYYYNKMCLRSERMEDCSNRTHAFTVYRDIDWSQAFGDKSINTNTRHECMERWDMK